MTQRGDEWEVFTGGRSTLNRTKMTIGIQKVGRFHLSPRAVEYLGSHVLLLYNRRERKIGFKPAEESTPGAFPVREHSASANSGVLSGLTFMKVYDIDPVKVAGHYPVTEENGMLTIQLPS